MSFDIMAILNTVAPWIGTALAGPLGGMAIEAACSAFGLEQKTVEALKGAITGATPEQMLALKAADQQFAIEMQKLGFSHIEKLAELEAADRDSARKREIGTGDFWTPRLIATLVIIAWCLVQYRLLGGQEIPQGMRELVARVLGTLDAALMCILYYYFGGSKGSDRQTELLAKAPSIEQ